MIQCILMLVMLLVVPGCMMGPHYKRPVVAVPQKYAQYPEDSVTMVAHKLTTGWEIFQDECLKKVLDQAVARNLDLQIALERIEQFRAQYLIERAKLLPEVNALIEANKSRNRLNFLQDGVSTQQVGANDLSFSIFRVGLETIWEIDFWGRIRHARNAAYNHYEAQIEDARDIYLLLLSNTASSYLDIQTLETTTALRKQRVGIDGALLVLAQDRFTAGLTSEIEVREIEAQLEESKKLLVILQTLLVTTRNGLAILLGQLPEELMEPSECTKPRGVSQPRIEPTLGLPSDLLLRRPDIRKAERLLASTTEHVGEAYANYFPRFSLLGTVGALSPCLSTLFNSGGLQWFIGQSTVWPIITFGRLRFNLEAAQSVERQALLEYAQTVLKAFGDVEDSLITYFNHKEQVAFIQKKLKAVTRDRDLIEHRFKAGLTDTLQFLLAEKNRIIVEEEWTDVQRDFSVSAVLLYKALGGGWSDNDSGIE